MYGNVPFGTARRILWVEDHWTNLLCPVGGGGGGGGGGDLREEVPWVNMSE